MSQFSQRSSQKELIDAPDISFADWQRCLQELDIINSRLGGHAITLSGLSQLAGGKKELTIAEIGCGGGDNLKVIDHWAKEHNINIHFIGIDINEACINYAKSKWEGDNKVEWISVDYQKAELLTKPDIIFSSLFCHHFRDNELINLFKWSRKNSVIGFFINDLQRHPLAYYSIKMLTRLFSKSYLIKNDAPISVKRGFKADELRHLLQRSGNHHFIIKWRWAFRYLVIIKND